MLDIDKAQSLLQEFYAGGKKRQYDRKAVIIDYDQPIDSTFYVVEGYVKIVSHNAKGHERIHYLYGPGDFFPVTWLFGNRTFEIQFAAFTQATIMQRTLAATKKFFENQPHSLLAVTHQQAAAYGSIVNLNMGGAQQRVAFRILTLCLKFGQRVDDHYLIDIPITLQELADMVRLTRERTGTVVADLEKKGCLIMGRRNIVVYDEPLKKYAKYRTQP